MAKGIAAVRDRIHELLTTTAGVARPLSFTGAPLTRATEFRGTEDQEPGPPDYRLRWAGESSAGDLINGPLMRRVARFALDLAVIAGGGEGAGSDAQETDAQLADIWEDVVQTLQDPNNRDYAATGWIAADGFTASEPNLHSGRMHVIGTFSVHYDVDLPSM